MSIPHPSPIRREKGGGLVSLPFIPLPEGSETLRGGSRGDNGRPASSPLVERSHPRKGVERRVGLTPPPLLHFQKRVERSQKKYPFFSEAGGEAIK